MGNLRNFQELDLKLMQSSTPKDRTISSKDVMNLNLTSNPLYHQSLESNSGLVVRNGVTNSMYQFASLIVYLLHVGFVLDMRLYSSTLK